MANEISYSNPVTPFTTSFSKSTFRSLLAYVGVDTNNKEVYKQVSVTVDVGGVDVAVVLTENDLAAIAVGQLMASFNLLVENKLKAEKRIK